VKNHKKSALTLQGVSKWFGGVSAVRGVDLVIKVGERRALIGPNGAGKTTLFNLITGELPLDEGKIWLFGRDVTYWSARQRVMLGLGRTYQITQIFPNLTVEENLFLAVRRRQEISTGLLSNLFRSQTADSVFRERVRQVAQSVNLEDALTTLAGELSYGKQRQLELGLALAVDPKILLLDEPTAGLSAGERKWMTQLLEKIDKKVTILFIEHNIDVALNIADSVSVMYKGSIIAEADPEKIRMNKRVKEVYLGSPEVNG